MSGDTPSGSPEALRPVTSRKLERLIPARRTPVGQSSARALSLMARAYTPLASGSSEPRRRPIDSAQTARRLTRVKEGRVLPCDPRGQEVAMADSEPKDT